MGLRPDYGPCYDDRVMESIQLNGIDGSLAYPIPHVRLRPSPAAYAAWQRLLLLVTDLSVLVTAGILALSLRHVPLTDLIYRSDVVMALAFAATSSLLINERVGLYRASFSGTARDQIYSAFAASAMGIIPPLLILLLLPSLSPFRSALLLAALFSAAGLSTARFVLHALRDRVAPPTARRIAIAGKPERVDLLPGDLSLTSRDSILRLPLQRFDEEMNEALQDGDIQQLQWLQNAIAWNCDTLIVTEALPPSVMPTILRFTEARGIKLAFAPLRLRPHACDFRVHRDGGVALLYPRSLAICTRGADLLRRVFDLAVVIPALIVLAPLLAAIALLVAFDSGAPVLYRQTRVGRYGEEFQILKFRTMTRDAEKQSGVTWAQAGDARVTRIGRFLRRSSLDELPQLINVLCGEMSIVGPRPERPFYVERFRAILPRYDERHLVRPGITGWSHLNMRRDIDTSAIGERLSYDLFYLENWSIFFDATIIFKTAAEFLFHEAA
jgi:exopolysaccharide biosynthesis polyprenyl glycosylphosphotransferase